MNIYESVTSRILKQLEAGVLPWRKTLLLGLPKNLTNNREYHGINILLLGAVPYRSRYWATAGEVRELGGQILEGAEPTPTIYWRIPTPEAAHSSKTPPGPKKQHGAAPFVVRAFNLDQSQGIDRPSDDADSSRKRCLQLADLVFDVMPDKPTILHTKVATARYNPDGDQVILPHLSQLKDVGDYYRELFKQLVRATGHARRLNRFRLAGNDSGEPALFEELVAELGAAFLCGFTGIAPADCRPPEVKQVAGWVEAIRGDNRLLARAASAAQKAADYIRGKLPPQGILGASNPVLRSLSRDILPVTSGALHP